MRSRRSGADLRSEQVPGGSAAAAAVLVALGGACGSVARALLARFDGPVTTSWPWWTLLVNVTGAFAIGILMVVLGEKFHDARSARLLLGTGVLGGYTTFSAVSVDVVQLGRHGAPWVGAAYLGVTVSAVTVACLVGTVATRLALAGVR